MYNGIQGKVIDMGQRTEKVFSRNMKFGKKKMREGRGQEKHPVEKLWSTMA